MSDDLTDSRRVRCPNQYLNIEIPADDNNSTTVKDRSERILPVYRSNYISTSGTGENQPRTLVNTVGVFGCMHGCV